MEVWQRRKVFMLMFMPRRYDANGHKKLKLTVNSQLQSSERKSSVQRYYLRLSRENRGCVLECRSSYASDAPADQISGLSQTLGYKH
jgi:hypothetical protein